VACAPEKAQNSAAWSIHLRGSAERTVPIFTRLVPVGALL
jgi:hypothetical protein